MRKWKKSNDNQSMSLRFVKKIDCFFPIFIIMEESFDNNLLQNNLQKDLNWISGFSNLLFRLTYFVWFVIGVWIQMFNKCQQQQLCLDLVTSLNNTGSFFRRVWHPSMPIKQFMPGCSQYKFLSNTMHVYKSCLL